jgi:2-methylcitrate dehydratase PrpD
VDAILRLVEHVTRLRYDDLPPGAVAAAKTFILDTLGVGIAGSGDAWAPRIATTAARWGGGVDAAVLGTATRLPALSAAVVNGYQIHGLEFDCVHEGAVVHPMATVMAAALAEAERRGGVDGKRFVTAVVAGVDVACSLGIASRGAMRFFRPANAGAFGAVAALGVLRSLDAAALADAFGIVYGHVSGTLQPHAEGSMLLGVQIGFNARGALTAVDLAADGLPGPREVLEGRYGYFRLFEGGEYDIAPVLDALGRTWRITELSHKPFPTGRLTHGTVDAIQRLRAEHGIAGADVDRLTARVPPLVARLVGRPDVPDPGTNYARLCLPFVAAIALAHGTVDVPDFRPDRLRAPNIHALAQRVEVVADGNPDENAIVPQTIEVALRDGRRHAVTLDRVLGAPDRALTREQHLDKFRRCRGYGSAALSERDGDRLIALVDALETVSDVRQLVALTTP